MQINLSYPPRRSGGPTESTPWLPICDTPRKFRDRCATLCSNEDCEENLTAGELGNRMTCIMPSGSWGGAGHAGPVGQSGSLSKEGDGVRRAGEIRQARL